MDRHAARLRIEILPKWLLCVPLVIQWFWLGARFGSLTLPSTVNPGIETGGLAGESKTACLALIPDRFAAWVAAWRTVRPGDDAKACRASADLNFPLIAKPDIGWCGYGVRRIDSDEELEAYQAAFPPSAAFMLQRYVSEPMEAGLFYLRRPGARHGRLLSITLRHPPAILGDGMRRVAELLRAKPTLRRLARSLPSTMLAVVPAAGERSTLTTVASLRVGATYEDASGQASPRLLARIDAIARAMPGFQFGRFDVRFADLDSLRRGRFSIIEVNGAGAEAIHLWDPALSIGRSLAGVFAKQALLFQLGDEMRALGQRPVGAVTLAGAWLRQQRLIGQYPESN